MRRSNSVPGGFFKLDNHEEVSNINKIGQRMEQFVRYPLLRRNLMTKNENGGTYPDAPLNGRAFLVISLPFLPILIYSFFQLFTNRGLILYAIGLALYFSVCIAFVISEVAIRPPWYHHSKPEVGLNMNNVPVYWQGVITNPLHDLGLQYEDVSFENSRGMTLRGWYIPSSKKHKIGIVCVHGGGRDRRAWLRHIPIFYDEGYGVLMMDFAEHGISDGNRRGFTFGISERYDVCAAVNYMKRTLGYEKIVVAGTSVGGAASILAAAINHSIDLVIAENPVACVEQFIIFHIREMIGKYIPHLISHVLFYPFYKLVGTVFLFRIGGLFASKSKPVEVIGSISPTPILLMHGSNDDLVPPDHSTRLFKLAKQPCELWIAPEAWHCALYDKYPKEYKERVLSFIRKHLH